MRFSLRGDCFLVVSGSSNAKLYDRDGSELSEFCRGDMYIRDLKKTKGHVAAITTCRWHPNDRSLFLTSSADGTIRVWHVEDRRGQKEVLIAKRAGPGNRLEGCVNSATFSADGSLVAGARQDGSICFWNWKTPYLRPTLCNDSAHEPGTEISSLAIHSNGHQFASRGNDGCVKRNIFA